MNLALMFEEWGVSHDIPLMLDITGNHKTSKTALQLLNRMLAKAYHPAEIPNILTSYSPVLGSSILDYLSHVQDGAAYIIEIIESGPE